MLEYNCICLRQEYNCLNLRHKYNCLDLRQIYNRLGLRQECRTGMLLKMTLNLYAFTLLLQGKIHPGELKDFFHFFT